MNFLYKINLCFTNIFQSFDKTCFAIFLGMFYSTVFFASFVMGYKIVLFHGSLLCASVFIFPILFPLNDSITEIYGVKVSYFMITMTIICEIIFSLVTWIVAILPSPETWPHQEIYTLLTKGFLQITAADSTALALGFFVNSYFLNKWGKLLYGKKFFIRSVGSTALGELVFTIITNLITFNAFHIANLEHTINIIISDYLLKMIYSIVICIPNALVVDRIKNIFNHLDCDEEILPNNVLAIKHLKRPY